jgi:hypothetical protein
MWFRLAICLLIGALSLPAQMKMNVEQLKAFLKSSAELRHDDRKVADYLKRINLTQRLDDAVRLELLGLGIGPRTAEMLQKLVDETKGLSAPATPVAGKPAPALRPPTLEQQQRLIKNLREYANNYTKQLPDFICAQVTRRYIDPSGLEFWQRMDMVTTRLTFFEQKEDYKVVMVNSTPTDIDYDRLGGATSAGEFGSMMREVFEDSTRAEFRWSRWATLRGRRNHVVEYRVAQPNSKWRISWQRTKEYVPGYRGLIYADNDTGMVTRITLTAEGIPPSFPIQEASTVLDYDFVKISDIEFLLPLKSVVRMREGRLLIKNETEFRMYRKFGAEAVITFDTEPEPLPEEATTEQPPVP